MFSKTILIAFVTSSIAFMVSSASPVAPEPLTTTIDNVLVEAISIDQDTTVPFTDINCFGNLYGAQCNVYFQQAIVNVLNDYMSQLEEWIVPNSNGYDGTNYNPNTSGIWTGTDDSGSLYASLSFGPQNDFDPNAVESFLENYGGASENLAYEIMTGMSNINKIEACVALTYNGEFVEGGFVTIYLGWGAPYEISSDLYSAYPQVCANQYGYE